MRLGRPCRSSEALAAAHPHSANRLIDARIVPGRSGNADPNVCPDDTFATGSTPIFLAVGKDGRLGKLCELIGAPELPGDPPIRHHRQRNAHRDALSSCSKRS
jgi:crotonobetainyl-CoA:carnitine CoA-transferase CaiB-like acyl-CoA transferase